jgi:cysteine-rich repeat protein
LLDPVANTAVRNLAAGTYWVTVEDWLNDDLVTAYVVDIEIRISACGDGFVSGSETCDDNNTANGDGCSSACVYEGAAETEPNDLRASASPLITAGNMTGRLIGTLATSTDVDVYSIVVPAGGGHVIGEVTDGRDGCPGTLALRLRNSSGTSLSSDTADGPEMCGRISPGGDSAARNLTAGTYYLEVTGSQEPIYFLDARVVAAGCGDLYMVTGEQCDDGNTANGDGCSSTCQFEQTETEPNDTFMTAMALAGPSRLISAEISPAGEEDWYSVTVAQGGSIHVAINSGGPDQCGSMDPDLEVFGPNGTTSLAQDDLDGQGYCPILYRYELWNLAAGTYYIKADGYDAADTFDYVLSVSVY